MSGIISTGRICKKVSRLLNCRNICRRYITAYSHISQLIFHNILAESLILLRWPTMQSYFYAIEIPSSIRKNINTLGPRLLNSISLSGPTLPGSLSALWCPWRVGPLLLAFALTVG